MVLNTFLMFLLVAGETSSSPGTSTADPSHLLRLKLMTEDCHLLKVGTDLQIL